MKKALITGISGQDGSYLAELLSNKDYEIYGFLRRSSGDPLERIQDLVTKGKIKIVYGNLRDTNSIRRVMEEIVPDEVYNLAALSDVGISFKCPEETFEVNYYGVGRIVNEALRVNPKVRIYQASTSEMFGKTNPPQNENSPFQPVSPYAEAKLKAHNDFVVNYRERDGVFICSGISFNHESPKRGKHFVTKKITNSLVKVKLGLQEYVVLGNLNAKRDWGFAGDYVEAMWMMLQQEEAEDFVIASGEQHSVREFIEISAKELGLSLQWQGEGIDEKGVDTESGKTIVAIDPRYFRPTEVETLLGDPNKAKEKLGWVAKTSFKELVTEMVREDLKLADRDLLCQKEGYTVLNNFE